MNTKPNLKINFTDFWSVFDKTDNFFYNLLSKNYNVEISETPDLLFYSTGSDGDHIKYNCTKVFYTGENMTSDFMLCDFAFSYRYNTARNYRLPLYALYLDAKHLLHRKTDAKKILEAKTGFCCFVVTNGACKTRNDFFTELSRYKQVDSGGQFLNNVGGPVADKHAFIKNYKFVIAFENTSFPGYTTEKIYEPFIQHCVPIYWGDPLVNKDFNTRAFINSHDYPSFEKVIERVIEVDNNDDLYMQYLNEPVFPNDEPNEFVDEHNILKRLDEIVAYHFSGKLKPKQKLRPLYFSVLTALQTAKLLAARVITLPVRIIHKLKNKN
nr:glycosyltransferase family 10 [uncultured Mucilaginibacter sp.]